MEKSDIVERFLSKVNYTDFCWNWNGGQDDKGYGIFVVVTNGQQYAHRVSYTIFKGEIKNGMQIHHICRNTICVNPDHLEMVTQKENWKNRIMPPPKRRCKNGHEDYITTSTGVRLCRKCRSQAVARSQKKKFIVINH